MLHCVFNESVACAAGSRCYMPKCTCGHDQSENGQGILQLRQTWGMKAANSFVVKVVFAPKLLCTTELRMSCWMKLLHVIQQELCSVKQLRNWVLPAKRVNFNSVRAVGANLAKHSTSPTGPNQVCSSFFSQQFSPSFLSQGTRWTVCSSCSPPVEISQVSDGLWGLGPI